MYEGVKIRRAWHIKATEYEYWYRVHLWALKIANKGNIENIGCEDAID